MLAGPHTKASLSSPRSYAQETGRDISCTYYLYIHSQAWKKLARMLPPSAKKEKSSVASELRFLRDEAVPVVVDQDQGSSGKAASSHFDVRLLRTKDQMEMDGSAGLPCVHPLGH